MEALKDSACVICPRTEFKQVPVLSIWKQANVVEAVMDHKELLKEDRWKASAMGMLLTTSSHFQAPINMGLAQDSSIT